MVDQVAVTDVNSQLPILPLSETQTLIASFAHHYNDEDSELTMRTETVDRDYTDIRPESMHVTFQSEQPHSRRSSRIM